jgi:LPLT family lysophospholipid transporter-like MFS transporter
MPKGFAFLILAQFFSGLADNAFLLLGIFFLQEQGHPAWWAPLLKMAFTLSYVVLASVVGPVADAFQKRHVMMAMNLLKLWSVVLLWTGFNPLVAFALTGFAASVYAPAKYGLLTETVPSGSLVKANAFLEVSVVLAVLWGVVLGGWLMDAGSLGADGLYRAFGFATSGLLVETQIGFGLGVICLLYVFSALLNFGMYALRSPVQSAWSWADMRWSAFWANHLNLWRDPLGGVSLRITTFSWGVGAVLQFLVLVWAQTRAGLTLQAGAYLQGLVALGVIGGAVMAALTCRIFRARRQRVWAVVLACLMPALALTQSLWLAGPMLLAAGWAGGMLLVPMNALLQHRGLKIMPPGRSIAVQGFNENLSVLVMLGLYSLLLAWEWPLLAMVLSLSLPLWLAVLPWRRRLVQRGSTLS